VRLLTVANWDRIARPLPVRARVWLFEQLARFGLVEWFWRDLARQQDEEFSRELGREFDQEIEKVLSGTFPSKENKE
jgi:hypothetical protein